MREDFSVELRSVLVRWISVEVLLVAYHCVNATGIEYIAKHYFTCLEGCFTKAEFEKLENTNLHS